MHSQIRRADNTADLYAAFEALLMDEESFREELRAYEGFDDTGYPRLEPRQIPPLVSQHLPWLKPTARNKMWNAVISSKATAGGFKDLYSVPGRGSELNLANLTNVTIPLLRRATRNVELDYNLHDRGKGTEKFRVGLINSREFLSALSQFAWHPDYEESITPILRFVGNATAQGRIIDWVVAWPQPSKIAGRIDLAGLNDSAPVVKRGRRPGGRIDFVGSDRKHTDALLPIARGLPNEAFSSRDGRGVVMIYLTDDRPEDDLGNKVGTLTTDRIASLLSVAAPASSTPHSRDLIQWSVRAKNRPEEVSVDRLRI